jgi:hypothetical protein
VSQVPTNPQAQPGTDCKRLYDGSHLVQELSDGKGKRIRGAGLRGTHRGPRDGTLQLIPIADGISYVFLRALQDDVAENDLCGAKPGRALGVCPEWHKELMAGMVSIPEVQPGDTVWWHPDICHATSTPAGKTRASSI